MNFIVTEQDMDLLRKRAATRNHKLGPSMFTKPLTNAAYAQAMEHLRRSPVKDGVQDSAPSPVQDSVPSSRKTSTPIPPPMSAFSHIPVGRYATPNPRAAEGGNDFDFWIVDRPETGRWAGCIFIERILGGGDEDTLRREKLHSQMQQRIAAQAIVDFGIEEASLKFGQLLKFCGDCGRHLTDEVSRDIGRGPVCRNKGR